MISKKNSLSLTILFTLAVPVYGDNACSDHSVKPEEMIITGVQMDSPLSLETDPKAPRQPLPAQDGADYLKTIPGFSVIRKGGTGGDPVLRGMSGSRLSLLQNGDLVLGGCSSHMDPPTAYIFPETYDRIRLIKGPQTVLYGPGNAAGVVLFERDQLRLAEPGWKFHGSLLGGSFGRSDSVLDLSGGTRDFYLRGLASHSQQDNYHDGDGTDIHSEYDRWNTSLSLGWTPSDQVTLELAGSRSGAEAAYADRGMDGAVFDRDNLNAKLILQDLSPVVKKVEARAYYNDVHHVMDNYTLREPAPMDMGMDMDMDMTMLMASSSGRRTEGASILVTLAPSHTTEWVLGLDTQANEHNNRMTSNQEMMPYQHMPPKPDGDFRQVGVFGEWTQHLAEQKRLITGLRLDHWQAKDLLKSRSIAGMEMPNPTVGEKRTDTLTSGFIRYEQDMQPITFYAGLGRNQRFPDYWEMINQESAHSISAFNVEPETTTQLDVGALYSRDGLKGSISLFYNQIDDYLLIHSGFTKPMGDGSRTTKVTRNIDAATWGLEADINYTFADHWQVEASVASVRGNNDTDNTHLAQLSPLEFRAGLNYNRPAWTAGIFWRAVAEQTRVDIGKGGIAGQDIGPNDSFNVLSLNLGWRAHKNLLLTGGVDNLLDETYAEHISKSGAMIAGYEQIGRINEPGRTLWLKMQLSFD